MIMIRTLCISSLLSLLLFTAGGPVLSPGEIRTAVDHPDLKGSTIGVAVLDATTGEEIYMLNASRSLIPASNVKLFTTAALLHYLKPEYSIKTSLLSLSRASGQSLDGDLYIKGRGDPTLSEENLLLLAKQIYKTGIRHIKGDLVADESFFDSAGRPPSWNSGNFKSWYGAPVAALSCNFNVVSIIIYPFHVGRPPLVVADPFPDFFKIENRATTVSGLSKKENSINAWLSYQGGGAKITVEGKTKSSKKPLTIIRSVEEPSRYALHGIKRFLGFLGVKIDGRDRTGIAPPEAIEIACHSSKPLSLVVRDMNKVSSNSMAESLLKLLGAEIHGPPGSTEKGIKAVMRWLKDSGIETDGVTLDDGSGLSAKNRLTAESIARLLVSSLINEEHSHEMIASLPVAGVDGTLKSRAINGRFSRSIRAKTGRTKDAVSLSGYILPREGKKVAFSILINNYKKSVWKTQRGLDRICNSIVSLVAE